MVDSTRAIQFCVGGRYEAFDRIGAQAKIGITMMASALLMSAIAPPAAADTVRWRNIIGIIEAGNLVGNIGGGGQPWSTLGGQATVDLPTGRVEFEVQGLVLAGGNAVGNTDGISQVKGTLVCIVPVVSATNPPTISTVAIDTELVPLSPEGDAKFSGMISTNPACNSSNVAFLVRIAANNRWIANGAVRTAAAP
jgi:hypothetical protein